MRKKIFIIPVFFVFFLFSLIDTSAQNVAPPEWQQCMACHALGKKLIGPDLVGITDRRSEEWIYKFIRNSQEMIQAGDPIAVQVWEEHNKIPMTNFDFTDDQIKGILDFIKAYDPSQPVEIAQAPTTVSDTVEKAETAEEAELDQFLYKHEKYGPGNTRPTFIVFLILLIIAVADLAFIKFIRAHFIHYIVILVSIFVMGEIVYVEAKALGRQEGYSPDQPVWFSHKVHAGQNHIDCLYCHSTAMESKSAGIPGINVCMNCHNVVKSGKITGTEEIAKVVEAWNTGKPIEWVRVHNLPDHVFFSHAQHVNAGKRQCQECHGPVEKMDRIVQVENLGMGWCIHCHRRTPVQFKENSFYQEYTRFKEKMESGEMSRVTVDDIGGNNCQTCHY
ncbi:MAG: c-type cytochrome [Bacteroidales bacterium]|nr:c-type cytochrome [Bacteroidales bacterium]